MFLFFIKPQPTNATKTSLTNKKWNKNTLPLNEMVINYNM